MTIGLMDMFRAVSKAVGIPWECAACGQDFEATEPAFRTTWDGPVEYYCQHCMNEDG